MAHYVMLSQANCKYCTAALGLLESKGHTVAVYDVHVPNNKAFVSAHKQTNTVPQLFDSELNFIGGYTDLKAYLSEEDSTDG